MNPLHCRSGVSSYCFSPDNAERPLVDVSSAQGINAEDETGDPEATVRTF